MRQRYGRGIVAVFLLWLGHSAPVCGQDFEGERVVNAVASRPDLWRQSAIVLTYDESDGFYDHVPPRILSYGPDQLPLARGIRQDADVRAGQDLRVRH